MMEPVFLPPEFVLYIHRREAERTNSPLIIRDQGGLEAAMAAPQASFGGQYLMDPFEMAASYLAAFAQHHPFMDGNKRVAAAGALSFLSINGYAVDESHDLELAEQVLGYLGKSVSKEDLARYFRERAVRKADPPA
jgi:death-on-curing protein